MRLSRSSTFRILYRIAIHVERREARADDLIAPGLLGQVVVRAYVGNFVRHEFAKIAPILRRTASAGSSPA